MAFTKRSNLPEGAHRLARDPEPETDWTQRWVSTSENPLGHTARCAFCTICGCAVLVDLKAKHEVECVPRNPLRPLAWP